MTLITSMGRCFRLGLSRFELDYNQSQLFCLLNTSILWKFRMSGSQLLYPIDWGAATYHVLMVTPQLYVLLCSLEMISFLLRSSIPYETNEPSSLHPSPKYDSLKEVLSCVTVQKCWNPLRSAPKLLVAGTAFLRRFQQATDSVNRLSRTDRIAMYAVVNQVDLSIMQVAGNQLGPFL